MKQRPQLLPSPRKQRPQLLPSPRKQRPQLLPSPMKQRPQLLPDPMKQRPQQLFPDLMKRPLQRLPVPIRQRPRPPLKNRQTEIMTRQQRQLPKKQLTVRTIPRLSILRQAALPIRDQRALQRCLLQHSLQAQPLYISVRSVLTRKTGNYLTQYI